MSKINSVCDIAYLYMISCVKVLLVRVYAFIIINSAQAILYM